MNEKKDKKSQKPEHVSKNWKSSQGIRLLAMVLAIVSGFFVAVTGVITVALGMGMAGDLQGSQKDIEKTLDTELLRSVGCHGSLHVIALLVLGIASAVGVSAVGIGMGVSIGHAVPVHRQT